MHTIQSFILRLMVDREHSETLRGSLQSLHTKEEQWNFRDEAELIELLKGLNAELSENNHEED